MPSKRPRAPPRVHGAGGEKVPVVIVTGFLGAGKTTLMEHLLANAEGQVIGCVVNDLAAINIDATLVAEAAKKTGAAGGGLHMVTLEDGCICCERSGDLLPCIDELLARKACGPDRRPFDLILVECTGMAEPSQMLASFSRPTSTARHVLEEVYLSSVLAMIDGPAFEAQYDSHARCVRDARFVRASRRALRASMRRCAPAHEHAPCPACACPVQIADRQALHSRPAHGASGDS